MSSEAVPIWTGHQKFVFMCVWACVYKNWFKGQIFYLLGAGLEPSLTVLWADAYTANPATINKLKYKEYIIYKMKIFRKENNIKQ